MDLMDLVDSEGAIIGTYDPATGAGVAYNPLDQSLASDIAAQWHAVGYGAPDTGFGFDRPTGLVDYAGYVPPADPIAAGLDVTKIFKTAGGVLYRYQKSTTPAGTVSYTPVQYTPGQAPGGNLLLYAAIAGIALLALS